MSGSSIVWVCSRIGGLTRNLERLLPQVTFQPVTEDKLKNIENRLNGTTSGERPQVLIADNSLIPQLIKEDKLPFKFIQVGTF